MLDQAQLNRIKDPETRQVIQLLVSLYEQALADVNALRTEVQCLKDEITHHKNDQGQINSKLIDEGGILVVASANLGNVNWDSLIEDEKQDRIDSFDLR